MPINVFVKSRGKLTLTDREYIGAGGEAAVYKKEGFAYKIYHDPSKMIPVGKIQELQRITPDNVLKPIDIIMSNNQAIGYIMKFVSDTHPICKLFTKSFRDKNGIDPKDMPDIVKIIQQTVTSVHTDGCLIVDLNEMNLLASDTFKTVYFIDVDSYQTKSYKATAIMESIRDPKVKGNSFTEFSDWFSFAVIAIQLYVGIHPYKGRHPDYKPNEWAKRMKDGVSIFDPDVSLPQTCYDFSLIPKAHYNWFQEIFVKNNRSIPPLPDEAVVIIPVMKYKVVQSTGDFDVKIALDLNDVIMFTYNFANCEFLVTKNGIYIDKDQYRKWSQSPGKVGVCDSGDELFPALCYLKDHKLRFVGPKDIDIDTLSSDDFMMRNGCIYSIYDGKLTECLIDKFGTKYILKTRFACNVSDLSTKVFDGVIFQDLLGKCYITLPYEKGKCYFEPIKELDGYRILDAKSEANVCVVIAEKKSKYDRFVIVFDSKFTSYKIRREEDVSYSAVNFTVKPNGVCIMATDIDVEIFKDDKIKKITNSPFDYSKRLFNRNGDIFFIDERRIYSVKSK